MRSAFIAIIGASVALAPPAAAAQSNNPAAPLSIAGARAGADLQDANDLGGVTVVLALIGAAVVIGLILLLDNDDEDEPASP